MKIKFLFNKFIALIVTVCLLVCITSVNSFSAVKNEDFLQPQNTNSLPLISPENGKITSINDTGSDLTVVNIQDLHCHKETQKKISNIIEEINKENKINKIYVEGGYGNIDISWLNKIEDKKIREQVLEQLLEDGEITAGEYYVALKNNTVQLKGLDEKIIHQQNVERLSKMMDNQEKYDSVIEKVRIEVSRLNKMYVNLENRRFSQEINAYKHNGGDSGQLYIKLFKYIDKINNNSDKYNNITKISKKDYPNMAAYIALDEESKKIKPEEISSQIQAVLGTLKSVLSYEQYSEMISKTNNLKDVTKLAWYINKYTTEKNIDLAKYGTLSKFLKIRKLNENLNPVELVDEERNLIEQIRFAVSYDRTEYEVAFLSDFEEYFEKYLKYGLTSKDWAWTKKGFEKFRKLYSKYAVIDRIKEIEDDFAEIDKYYDVNDQRNSIFVNNILDGEKTAVKIRKSGIRTSKEIIKDSKEVIIVIAGGYHSNELSDVLSKKLINDMVITPNITGNIEKANNKYKRTIKEQAIMDAQALAFRLASCSNDITQQRLLLKAGIEALKKGNINEKEIEKIVEIIKVNDRDNNIYIQYENGEFKLNGNTITLDDIENISDEANDFYKAVNAVTEFFEKAIKVFEPKYFNKAYNATFSRLLFSVAALLSDSNGLPSFETEQMLETEDIKEIVIDGQSYSFEKFLFLSFDEQNNLIKNVLSKRMYHIDDDVDTLGIDKNNIVPQNLINNNKVLFSNRLNEGKVVALYMGNFNLEEINYDEKKFDNFRDYLIDFFNRDDDYRLGRLDNNSIIEQIDGIKHADNDLKYNIVEFLFESVKNAYHHGNGLDGRKPIYIWLEKSDDAFTFYVANKVDKNQENRDERIDKIAKKFYISGSNKWNKEGNLIEGIAQRNFGDNFKAGYTEDNEFYITNCRISKKDFPYAELQIFESDKTAPFWEELVFGTAITSLIAVFIVSNPFGWLTGIVAAGLFTASRLGFIGIHSVVEYFKYGKDKNEIRKNFMARLLPTTILSIPYAVALLSMEVFTPGVLMATGVAILLHGYWNDNEETIKNYLSKIPLVKNLPYLKMSIGEEKNYDLLRRLPLKDPFGGINNSFNIEMFPNVMNKMYSILLVLNFAFFNQNQGERYVLDSILNKIKKGEISNNFIKTVVENNNNIENLNSDDLKAIITGIIVSLYSDGIGEIFNENVDNFDGFLQYVFSKKIKNAEFNDVITEDFPKEALASSDLQFRTFEYKEQNARQDDLALPYRNTLIGLVTDAVHELRHIKLERKNKNYPGFLPEFYAETGSVLDILKLAQKCETKEEKEEFYKTLPIHYGFQLLSSEHRTARAFNQIFFDVFETDISKWEALENIIFNVNTGKDEKTPIEYIEVIINEMEKYIDEKGSNVFDTADIERIENKMQQSWQYFIYKTVKSDPELKKEIDKKIRSGEIIINIEKSNESAYTNKWLYPGYEYLGSKEPSAELIETIVMYYNKNINKKPEDYYKILYLKNNELFKQKFEIYFNFEPEASNSVPLVPKPSIKDTIYLESYRDKMETKEKEFLSEYSSNDLDNMHKELKISGISENDMRALNYARVMKNKNNSLYLMDIVCDTNLETEVRLLAYGYIIANNREDIFKNIRKDFSFEEFKNKTVTLLKEYVDSDNEGNKGKKKIKNDMDLRAVGVGVALTLLDERYYENEIETKAGFGFGIGIKYMPFIKLENNDKNKLYNIILKSNIVKEGGKTSANSRMFFASVAVKSIAHEIGHNIFDYKQGKDKNITLQELAADVSASMLMQILEKNVIKNVSIKDYGNKLFANGTIKNGIEFSFLEEHNAADGLIFLLFTTIDRYLGKEMSFSEFFKILLDTGARDAGKIGYNDLRNKSQSSSLANVIDYYIAYLKDKYKDDADKINKLEQVIKEVDSWKVIIPEIIMNMETENKNINLYNFVITLIAKNLTPDESYWKYKDNKDRIEHAIVSARSEQERHLIIYNSLFYPSNLVSLANTIENYMNTLSETHIKTITLEVLKNKDINLYNIDTDKLSEKKKNGFKNKIKENLSDMEKNILVKLIIVKDELDAVDKFVLRTLLEEKGISSSQIDEWLKDNVIYGQDEEDGGAQLAIRALFAKGMRSSLSYDERKYIMNIIDSNKDDVLKALYAEQEMALKLKIVSKILTKVEGKFITSEDVHKTVERIFEKTSEDKTITEKDLDAEIIIETLEEILREGYEKDQGLVSSALLPENQRTIYEWMRDKNFESSFIEKLKKSVEMAWKEFSPSLYSNFSKFHFTKDKSAAQNLQKITLLSAVISALTAGITMFWLNPAESSVMFVRLGIWAFSVIGITSVITFLTNIISHSYIVYNFMKEIEQNKIDNETGENIREKLEKIIYKTEGSVTIDLSNDEFDINNEDARKKLKNEIEKFVENCDKEGRTGEIIINNDQKEGLRHYSIGISDNYLNNLSDKKISVYVKEGNTKILLNDAAGFDSFDSKSAILFDTEEYVNKAVLDGKSSLITALGVAVKEFLEVYKARSFYKGHKGTESRLRALMLSSASYLIPGIIGVAGILMPAIPLTTVLIAFIVSIFATNIGLHILIDFKAIRTRQEMIENMRKDMAIEIELKGNKMQVNKEEEEVMPVYVISEDLGKLGYDSKELRNTGLKTGKGESVFAVETEGAIVLGTRSGAGAKEIAQVLNESKVLKELIKDKISGKIQVSDMDIIVEDEKYIEQKQKEKDFKGSDIIFEEGIMIVKELKGQSRQEIMEEFKKLSEVKQAIGITLADKMIISLEDIKDIEKLNTAIKTGKARKVITRQQSEQLGIGEKELLEIRKKGIEVYIKEGEKVIEFDTRKEIETEIIFGNITMQQLQQKIINSEKPLLIGIEKLAGMFKSNQADIIETYSMFETLIGNFKMNFGIGQLKQKDVEAMAYNVRYEEIPVSWEDLKESSEIKIMYNNIGEGLKEVFKGAIEERILAKQEIGENRLSDKKLERLLGKMLKKQKEKKIGKKKFNYEDDEKFTIEDGKREIYEIMAERNINEIEDEESILKIIELIPVVADRQMSISEEISREDIAKDYRAMLSAA